MKPHRLLDPLLGLERRLTRRPGPAAGVLLISAGGLGDTVLFALAVERFAALARPGETVTVLLRKDAAKMAFLLPPGIRVEAVDFADLRRVGPRRRLLLRLYRAHYRLVVSTDFVRHPDLDEALAAACAAPDSAALVARPWPKHQRRLDRAAKRWRRLVEPGPVLRDKLLRLADLARALTGAELPPPQVALPPARLPAAVPLPEPTLFVQPFSAVKAKQSPPDLYRRLHALLPPGWAMRIAGHPSDLDRNPEFRPLLDLPGVAFEPAPFAELAGKLRSARLVVSVDTACFHLAAALGAPTLCLASAAYVGEIVPYDPLVAPPSVRVLWQSMPCQGCLGDCRRPLVDSMYPCVAALDPDLVVETVASLLGNPP
ncbi:glycosyltransferase family 9 protein [Phaeospirillum tilakii]|uniref:Glycosyltransferase family 9 protein n=1 Tax=Phaeospirillum tilakii TaxID=741673 RepID=A0ABW5CEF7_9PROT